MTSHDFFYWPKSERRVILFLSILLGILTCVTTFTHCSDKQDEEATEAERKSMAEIEAFVASLRPAERKNYPRYASQKYSPKAEAVLAPFEPNLADSLQLLRLGLPSFIVHNIIRYREAGGKFRTPKDFSRIYGLSADHWKTLEPYVYISEDFRPKRDTLASIRTMEPPKDTIAFYKYPEGTQIDINRADTAELKKIPGIGSATARAIVAYRNKLGGFYEVSQLKEIERVEEDLARWFKLEEVSLRKIDVNRAGLDKLRAHPYLNFYQAKVIMEHKRKKGKLKSLSQLSLYEEFTGKDLERLSHYLAFD